MNSKPFFIVAEENIGMYPVFVDAPIDSAVSIAKFENNKDFIDFFKENFPLDLTGNAKQITVRFSDEISTQRKAKFLEECRLEGLHFGNFRKNETK